MRTITIGARTQYVTRVSDADYDFLMQFKWTYAVSHKFGQLVYARRSIRLGGRNVTVLMHHEIQARAGQVRPTDRHTTDHEDGDSLHNVRENLRWLTPKEQMRNRRGHRSRPIGWTPALAELDSIPY